ncbi:MAG TPA: hypothetical protein VJ396_07005 [Acidiferrobacterales bacterium]|nr:hypothetical protein [Acidiferrobacterales bacterium]
MRARDFGSECIVPSHLPFSADGFPVLSVRQNGNTNVIATRYVYRLFVGKVTHDQAVSHRCGNNGCINPAHLYLRNRSVAYADKGGRQRITSKDRWYIRRSALSLSELDAKFDYGRANLSSIRQRKRGATERFSLRYALLVLWEHATRRGRRA